MIYLHRKIVLTLIMFFIIFCVTAVAATDTFTAKADNRAVFYGKLLKVRKVNKQKMIITVDQRYFTITDKTPILFKQAPKLLNQKVEVFYNNNDKKVVYLYQDTRDDDAPR